MTRAPRHRKAGAHVGCGGMVSRGGLLEGEVSGVDVDKEVRGLMSESLELLFVS